MEKRIENIEADLSDIRKNHLAHIEVDVAVLKQIVGEHRKLLWTILTIVLGTLGKILFF